MVGVPRAVEYNMVSIIERSAAMSSPKILSTAFLVVLTLVLAPAAAAATCGPTWTTVPSPAYSTGEDTTQGVAVRSDTDVWAVGLSDAGGFVQQWNGVSWTTRLGPTTTGYFFGVAATSTDVWVVGERFDSFNGNFISLVRRWDGTSWSTVPTPNGPAGTDNRLESVVALSPVDVWAAGQWYDPNGTDSGPLLIHWDGVSWTEEPPPDLSPGGDAQIRELSASGPDEIWAVGTYTTNTDGSGYHGTLVLNWDGGQWTQIPAEDLGTDFDSANFFSGVTALSDTDAWAVGGFGNDFATQGLIEHWNGADWTAVPSPSVGVNSALSGVAALGADDVWAVGRYEAVVSPRMFSQHWDGSAWINFRMPNVPGAFESLNAIGATPSGNLWAVGSRNEGAATLVERLCPIKVRDAGFAPAAVTVEQGDDVAWSFPSYNSSDHSVTDDSGMGAFDSGLRSGGGSYAREFRVAGTYPVVDSQTSNTSLVAVPVLAAAAPGLKAKITWSAGSGPPGSYVVDVQVRKPGAASFTAWKTGVTTASGTYTATSAGNYRFRARLRNGSGMSDWSPVKAFFIS
jgi:plastocyanin